VEVHAPFPAVQFRVGVAVAVSGGRIVQMVVMVVVAGMSVLVAVFMGMAVAVLVGMAVHRTVRVGVLVAVDMSMLVIVFVGMLVRMIVSMFMLVALDLGFTLAAAANGTHAFSPKKQSAVFSNQSSVNPGGCCRLPSAY
jgi:hypothetical protein